ncbi:jg489, partial [Pararge aegeria aegeria]
RPATVRDRAATHARLATQSALTFYQVAGVSALNSLLDRAAAENCAHFLNNSIIVIKVRGLLAAGTVRVGSGRGAAGVRHTRGAGRSRCGARLPSSWRCLHAASPVRLLAVTYTPNILFGAAKFLLSEAALEHGVKHHYRHGTQRSQSLNRGHSLSRSDGTW